MLARQGDMLGAEVARMTDEELPGEACNLGLEMAAPHLNYRMSDILETKTIDGVKLLTTAEGHWMVDGDLIIDAAWVGDALNLIAGLDPQ